MRKVLLFFGAAFATAFANPTPSLASDHIDGPKTTLDSAADLTDLYSFTSPRDPTRLVLVMNVHPLAGGGSRFSDAVDYKFRIRPIDDTSTLKPAASAARERSITCNFSKGSLLSASQLATCTFQVEDGTEVVAFETRSAAYRAGGEGSRPGIRVFAGVRSDTWFLDAAKTLKYNAGLPVLPLPGVNALLGQNVLSIVVEIDKRRLPGPLLAVAAQTVRKRGGL